MRTDARKRLKITLIEDSRASKDPAVRVMNSINLHPGSDSEPVRSSMHGPDCWIYRGAVFRIEGAETSSDEEVKLRVKSEFIQRAKEIQKIRRKVEAFEGCEKLPSARRERILESIRMFVWQRDEGRCVECGGKERLEFDHIIPVVEGGSTTERNLQLLCEACNRKKGRRI
jgi:hypothetical protein